LAPIIVVHANHARELDNQVQESMGQLRNNKLILLNQAVLLKGVNDSLESQIALSHRLIEIGVLPYYLHQLDRVHGASHFEVPLATGIELIQQMRARLPGYLVPRFVREVPGEPGKTVLA
jgi:L-lysine 2,3-aminomutase